MAEGDKQSQQDEYYLLVTEVIGGISSEITNHENRLVKVEEKIPTPKTTAKKVTKKDK